MHQDTDKDPRRDVYSNGEEAVKVGLAECDKETLKEIRAIEP